LTNPPRARARARAHAHETEAQTPHEPNIQPMRAPTSSLHSPLCPPPPLAVRFSFASFWVPGELADTVVAACLVRVQQYRACPVGPLVSRTPVRVRCFSVLTRGVRARGRISCRYRVCASYVGHDVGGSACVTHGVSFRRRFYEVTVGFRRTYGGRWRWHHWRRVSHLPKSSVSGDNPGLVLELG
jgi:hypothetical protein